MKRRMIMVLLSLVAILICAVGAVVIVVVNPTTSTSVKEDIAVDPAALRRHVEALSSPDAPRSWENPVILEAAADYIENALTIWGFDVHHQSYEVGGDSYRNLTAFYGPKEAPVIVVGAHYDACGEQPAADDNASGVAGLIELAGLLSAHRPQLHRRIELVAFTLEEPPFFRTENMGSAVHSAALAREGVEVDFMISIEMIGFFSDESGSQNYPLSALKWIYPNQGDFICLAGRLEERKLTRRLKSRMKGGGKIPVWSINAPASIPGIDFSDHLNYWQQGFPAVMLTDTAFYRNPNYHQKSDLPETLDYDRMAEVVNGLYAAITLP